jgi:tRNA pseudouridine38-40 synthase
VITADSFLQRMVRNIVGVLVHVGSGKLKATDMQHILALKDRSKVKIKPAPPQGLYLVDVYF